MTGKPSVTPFRERCRLPAQNKSGKLSDASTVGLCGATATIAADFLACKSRRFLSELELAAITEEVPSTMP
jgi:hypothetical protein